MKEIIWLCMVLLVFPVSFVFSRWFSGQLEPIRKHLGGKWTFFRNITAKINGTEVKLSLVGGSMGHPLLLCVGIEGSFRSRFKLRTNTLLLSLGQKRHDLIVGGKRFYLYISNEKESKPIEEVIRRLDLSELLPDKNCMIYIADQVEVENTELSSARYLLWPVIPYIQTPSTLEFKIRMFLDSVREIENGLRVAQQGGPADASTGGSRG